MIHSLTAVRARSKRNGEFEHTIAAAVSHQRVKVKYPQISVNLHTQNSLASLAFAAILTPWTLSSL